MVDDLDKFNISKKNVQQLIISSECLVAPLPPPLKRLMIDAFREGLVSVWGNQVSCIETGTFHGDTTEYLSSVFYKVITIESHEPLYSKAIEKFRKNDNVEVLFGDSASAMEVALKKCDRDRPILFFLDAHFSGEGTGKGDMGKTCPTFGELACIQNFGDLSRCAILIDDMRNFGDPNRSHYPNINYIKEWARMLNLKFRSSSDIIQIADENTMKRMHQLFIRSPM